MDDRPPLSSSLPPANEFRNLFLHSVHGLNIVTILVKVLAPAKVLEILESLLVFLGPECSVKFVKNAVQAELREGQDEHYFRSLCVGARVSTLFGRLITRDYVKQVVGPILQQYFDDASQAPSANQEQDKEMISKYSAILVAAICNSYNLLPKELVTLCRAINEVTEPMSEAKEPLAKFLFTEVVFPAIAEPVPYDIFTVPPRGAGNQAIAKVLQNIVSEPDFKDSFLEDLKDFITRQRAPIYEFLDKLVDDTGMIEDRPESVFVSDISAIEARQNLYSAIYSSLSKINEELASVYNKHKLGLISILLSNAIDSIAPEDHGPVIMSPPFSPGSPITSFASLNIDPPLSPSRSSERHQRGRLSFLTLKRDTSSRGMNDKARASLIAACKSGDMETVKEFFKGDREKILLESVDREGRTPFMIAAFYNSAAVVKWLMHSGCNINHKDYKQWTALHYACYFAHEDTLRAILSTHVSVDEAKPHQPPPELAVTERTLEGFTPLNLLLALPPSHITKVFVIKLLKKGANMNALGPNNETPLIAAVKCGGNVDLIRSLLELGADPAIPLEFPAAYWAIKLGEVGISRLFGEFGFAAVPKEGVDEKFATLNLDHVLKADIERRTRTLHKKREIESAKQEEEPKQKQVPKRNNSVVKSHSGRARGDTATSFFSSTELLRLNPIPQPIVKETNKRRSRLTPRRRAELLDRKTLQAHDLTIYLEHQVDVNELPTVKTATSTIPATMTIAALMKKCQTELFTGTGIKWEADEWHLFLFDEIPVAGEKQLWECDLEQSETMTLRVISAEEKEALKDIVFIKLIIPPVVPHAPITSTTPRTNTTIHESSSSSSISTLSPTQSPPSSTPSTPTDISTPKNSLATSPIHKNALMTSPSFASSKNYIPSPPRSPPSPTPTPATPLPLIVEIPASPLDLTIPSKPLRMPNITIQLPEEVPSIALSQSPSKENGRSSLSPLSSTCDTTRSSSPQPSINHTARVNEKIVLNIKIHNEQNLNMLLTDIWDSLPVEIRDNVDLWYFYLYDKNTGIPINGEMSLGSYALEFFDVLTLRPSPIFAFDVVPEEASPFYVPIPIPPIVVNSEATVKDTINVLIQWVAKHSPKSVNQYAITTSSSTPVLSNFGALPGSSIAPSAALPPLPGNISPTLSRNAALSKQRKTTKNAAQGMVAGGSMRSPTSPYMRAPSPSFSSGLSLNSDLTHGVVRSVSADAASGLGGSLVAAAPRSTPATSALNILREPSRKGSNASVSSTGSSPAASSPPFGYISSSPHTNSPDYSTPPFDSPPLSSALDSTPTTPRLDGARESPRGMPRVPSSPRNRVITASMPPSASETQKRISGGYQWGAGSSAIRGMQRGARSNPELLPTLGITPPPIYGSTLGLMLHMHEAMCWMLDHDTLSSYSLIPGAIMELREKPELHNTHSMPESEDSMRGSTAAEGARNRVRFKLVWSGEGQLVRPPVSSEALEKANLPFTDSMLENPKLFVLPGEDKCVVNEVKLVFLGDGHSGKSSLLQCLKKFSSPKDKENIYGGKPKPYEKSGTKAAQLLGTTFSEGLDIEEWMFSSEKDQKHIVFHSWDFITQDVTSNPQQFFLAKGAVYVIVFNILQEREANIEYWLEMIQTRARGSPVLLCGTHLDDKRIPKHENKIQVNASKYFQKFQNIVDTSLVSCKSNKGIWQFAAKLVETVSSKSLAGNQIPVSYIKLRKRVEMKKMEAVASNNLPIMSLTEFKKMAAEFQIENKAAMDALQYLHRAGSLLYLGDNEPALSDTVFLDCQWLMRLMGTVTSSTLKIKAGILTRPQLEHIWRHYSHAHYEKMLVLMEQFNVLLRMPGTNTYLIPTCLPDERPSNARESWPPWEDNANQSTRIFEFQFLPLGFLGRLMVRVLAAFTPVCYWKNGLLVQGLRNGKELNAKALIEYNPTMFRLKVTVRYGSAAAQGFTRILWETIHNFTNAWYHNRQRSVMIECPHCLRMHSYDPFIFNLKTAEQAAAEGSQYLYCRGIRPVRIDQWKVAMDVTLTQVNHMTVPFEALQVNELIGEGSYATVYRGVWRNKIVAIKKIDLSSIEQGEDLTAKFGEFRREVLLMSGLEHPNIVALKGICLKPFCMITEFLPHGDLRKYLENPTNELTWHVRLKIAYDIAQGINFLHSTTPSIIHRDLKSPNILIGTTPTAPKIVAKVADFGLSIRSASQLAGREVWNISWLAPEVMKSRQYTEKVDVYSFGMILWELYTQQMPFEEFKQMYRFDAQLEDEIKRGLRPSIPEDMPDMYRELVEACWGDDPASRPTFEDILQSIKRLQHALVIEQDNSPPITPTTPISSTLAPPNPFAPLPTPTMVPRSPSFGRGTPPSPLMSTPSLERKAKLNSFRIDDLATIGEENEEISFVRQTSPNAGSVQCMLQVNDVMWIGCGDGTISRWDIATHVLLPPAKQEHSDAIYALVVVGNQVWSSSKDASMAIWEKCDVSKPVKVIKIPGKDFVTSFALVGKYVWTGSSNGSIKQWSTKGKLKKELNPKGIVSIGCMSVQEPYVIVGTERMLLMVDMNTFTVTKEMDAHKNMIHNIVRVDDNLWTCSSDKTLKVWSLSGDLLKTIEGHSGRVFCLMHVGQHVWSGSWDKSIFVWDKQKYTFLYEMKGHFKDTVSTMVAVEKDEKVIEVWCGSWDKTICNYEYKNPPQGHSTNKVLMEGYLMKDTRALGKRKRYFVLYKQKLMYFDSAKDAQPIFNASLLNTNVQVTEEAPESTAKRHVFHLAIGSHKFVLSCDAEQEYKNWIHAFKSVAMPPVVV